MSTLAEIEAAVEQLPPPQQEKLLSSLMNRLKGRAALHAMPPTAGRNVLDIAPVSVGEVFRPLASDDDLLGEMLAGRA